MEELISFCETEAACLDLLRTEQYYTMSGSTYTSLIKFDGWPILPPVMTQQRRQEMQLYKHQAMMVENRIKARIRQQVLAKVDAVLKQISSGERKASSTTSSAEDTDVPPLEGIDVSENEDQEQHPEVRADAIQQVESSSNIKKPSNVEEMINTPSPRTCTKDSGVFSRGHTTVDSTDKQSLELPVSEAGVDDKLDTMADVTDLSSEDIPPSEDDYSDITTVKRMLSSDEHNKDSSASTDNQVSYESEESSQSTVCQEEDDSNKENVELAGAPQPTASDSEETQRLDQTLEEASTKPTLPPGSRERVEQLVKKLDSALKHHERQQTMTLSQPSTNSSSATFSSDEMNRTVIDRKEIITEGQAADHEANDSAENSDEDHAQSSEQSSPKSQAEESVGDTTIQEVRVPTELDTDNAITATHQEEASLPNNNQSSSLNSSLLSRVALETPEETSEDVSEQDISHSAPECVIQESDVPTSSDVSVSVPSPGPMHTPDLSNISHVTEDSINDQPSPISVAVQLGGCVHRLKHSVDYGHTHESSSPPADSEASASKSCKSQSPNDSFIQSVHTSQFCTESTELAKYMENTMETIPSSMSTLPYTRDAAVHNTGLVVCRTEGSSLAPDTEPTLVKREAKQEDTGGNSCDVADPSPDLISAHDDESKQSPSGIRGIHHVTRPISLTSSMEDLKLKPVQRKLDYSKTMTTTSTTASVDPLRPILKKTTPPSAEEIPSVSLMEMDGKSGKEEHLNKYLQQLSQMPSYDNVLYSGVPQNTNQIPLMTGPYDTQSFIQPLNPLPQMASYPIDDTGLAQLSQEELIQLQVQYFERMRQQLIEQQRQQLALLFAEQERQQLLLQQELLQHQQQLQQQQQLAQSDSLVMQKKRQLQQTNAKLKKCADTMKQMTPQSANASTIGSPESRPYSVPVSRVSFAPSPLPGHYHSTSKSPSGVYCNQDFPISSQNGSLLDPCMDKDLQQQMGGLFMSPAVLRYSAPVDVTEQQQGASGGNQMFSGGVYLPPQFVSTSLPATTARGSQPGFLQNKDLPPSLQKKFEKVTALAKGFLVRRLMKTNKVQELIKIIKDTAEFALHIQQETPIKKGICSQQDKVLHERVLAQLTAAMYEIHEIFFEISTKERMAIIRQSRILEQEKKFKQLNQQKRFSGAKSRGITSASKKAMDRKRRAKAAEAIVFGHSSVRPKSCPPNTSSPKNSRTSDLRALKPIQAQLSPIKPEKSTSSTCSVLSNGVKKQASPRAKLGTTTVKRIQSKPKSVNSKPVKKVTAASAVQKTSQHSSHNGQVSSAGSDVPSSKASTKSGSQTNKQPGQAGSSTTASHSDRRATGQASMRRITPASVQAGNQAAKSAGSTKSGQMVRHTSQTNKARVLSQGTSDAAQNMIKRIMAQSKAAIEK